MRICIQYLLIYITIVSYSYILWFILPYLFYAFVWIYNAIPIISYTSFLIFFYRNLIYMHIYIYIYIFTIKIWVYISFEFN